MSKRPGIQLVDEDDARVNDSNTFQKFVHRHCETETMSGDLIEEHMLVLARLTRGMKAASNTTPLRYLIAIEQEHLLGQLFEKVCVPVAVYEELTDSNMPETVRGRMLSMPQCPTGLRFGRVRRDKPAWRSG